MELTLKEQRQIEIKAHNYLIKNQLELGNRLNMDYTNGEVVTPLVAVLIKVYTAGYIAGADKPTEIIPCEGCKTKAETIEELEDTIEDLTDLKL